MRSETKTKTREMRKNLPKYSGKRARAESKRKRDERHEAKHMSKAKKAFKKRGFAGFGKVVERHKNHPVKKA